MSYITRLIPVAAALIATASWAQAPATTPPPGSTGLCKDGTYWTGATKSGACRGHKGVKDWYGASGSQSASAPASQSTATPKPSPANTPPAAPAPAAKETPAATPAPGGGPGMVWVNKSSKVYHCPTDKWYGKTKNGEYLSEQDAKAQGYHADHGKACS